MNIVLFYVNNDNRKVPILNKIYSKDSCYLLVLISFILKVMKKADNIFWETLLVLFLLSNVSSQFDYKIGDTCPCIQLCFSFEFEISLINL